MQHSIQLPKLKSMIIAFSSVFATTLLFSCSKNVADVGQPTVEETTANASSNTGNGNTIHAVPFENEFYVPCANGGAGENVVLNGFINYIYQLSWTDNGFTMVYHDNAHKVTGTGVSSGESFVASGGTNGVVMGSWVNSQWIGTTIGQLRIVGRNTNFVISYKYHITVTQDGTVVVETGELTVDCN
ncbi:MAG TPA: hypothetical protein VFP97_10620 [Chitinophagaceae bacterium]|nr:hypothetical protein [Chitinophagaceae bacterium]